MKATYPQALVLEVKMPTISSADCFKWVADFSITHTLLRDNGQAQSALSLAAYDVLVMDRYLEITFRQAPASLGTVQTAVMAELAKLMP